MPDQPYQFGDVVDGHRWTITGWEPVEPAARTVGVPRLLEARYAATQQAQARQQTQTLEAEAPVVVEDSSPEPEADADADVDVEPWESSMAEVQVVEDAVVEETALPEPTPEPEPERSYSLEELLGGGRRVVAAPDLAIEYDADPADDIAAGLGEPHEPVAETEPAPVVDAVEDLVGELPAHDPVDQVDELDGLAVDEAAAGEPIDENVVDDVAADEHLDEHLDEIVVDAIAVDEHTAPAEPFVETVPTDHEPDAAQLDEPDAVQVDEPDAVQLDEPDVTRPDDVQHEVVVDEVVVDEVLDDQVDDAVEGGEPAAEPYDARPVGMRAWYGLGLEPIDEPEPAPSPFEPAAVDDDAPFAAALALGARALAETYQPSDIEIAAGAATAASRQQVQPWNALAWEPIDEWTAAGSSAVAPEPLDAHDLTYGAAALPEPSTPEPEPQPEPRVVTYTPPPPAGWYPGSG